MVTSEERLRLQLLAQHWIDKVKYRKRWLVKAIPSNEGVFICWAFYGKDATGLGGKVLMHSRKWFIPWEELTEEGLVKAAMGAAIAAEEHEARERFTYGGVRVFDPHAFTLPPGREVFSVDEV